MMKTKKFKRIIGAATAAVMTFSIMNGSAPGIRSLMDDLSWSVSADLTLSSVTANLDKSKGNPVTLFENNDGTTINGGQSFSFSQKIVSNPNWHDYFNSNYKFAVITESTDVKLKALVSRLKEGSNNEHETLYISTDNSFLDVASDDTIRQSNPEKKLAPDDLASGNNIYYFSYDKIMGLTERTTYGNPSERDYNICDIQIELGSSEQKIYGVYAVPIKELFNFDTAKNKLTADNTSNEVIMLYENQSGTKLHEGEGSYGEVSFAERRDGDKQYYSDKEFGDYIKSNYKFAVIADASRAAGAPNLSVQIWRRSTAKCYFLSNDNQFHSWEDSDFQEKWNDQKIITPSSDSSDYIFYYDYNSIKELFTSGDGYDPNYDRLSDLYVRANNGPTQIYGVYAIKTAARPSDFAISNFDDQKSGIKNSAGQTADDEKVILWEKNDGFDVPYYFEDHTGEQVVRHAEFGPADAKRMFVNTPELDQGEYISPGYEIAVMVKTEVDPVLELGMSYKLDSTKYGSQTMNKRYCNGGRTELADPNYSQNHDYHLDGIKADCNAVDYSRKVGDVYYWTYEDIINALDDEDRAYYEEHGDDRIVNFNIGGRNPELMPQMCFYGIYAVPTKIKQTFSWDNIPFERTDDSIIFEFSDGFEPGTNRWFNALIAGQEKENGGNDNQNYVEGCTVNKDNAKPKDGKNIKRLAVVADTKKTPVIILGTWDNGSYTWRQYPALETNPENSNDTNWTDYSKTVKCREYDGEYTYYYDYADIEKMITDNNDTLDNLSDLFVDLQDENGKIYGVYALTEDAAINKPTISDNNVTWTVDKTSITVNKTGTASNNIVTVEGAAAAYIGSDATINVAEGGTLKLDPTVDSITALTLTGAGSSFKLGLNSSVTLAAGQTAVISADGEYASVSNSTETTFYQANSKAYVDIPETAMPADFKVKAIKFVDDLPEYDFENFKTLKVGLTLESRLPKTNSQIMSLKAIGLDSNGKMTEKKHLTFGNANVKVHMPLGTHTSNLAGLILRYINDFKCNFVNVDYIMHSDSFDYTTDHFSSWVFAQSEDYNITVPDTSNGSVSADKTKAKYNEVVTLTVTPESGYHVSEITVNGKTCTKSGDKYTFKMPAQDAVVRVTFGKNGSSVNYETVTDGGITYHVYSDHAEVAEVDTATETAVIKDKVGGENVTAIAENAFNSCTALRSVTIPETVEEIAASAFWGCTALTSITIPKTVTTIDKNAFSHCTALKEIVGYTGSAAQRFAEANGYAFKALDSAVTTVTTETSQTTTTSTTTVTTVTESGTTAAETTTTAGTTTAATPAKPTNIAIDNNGVVTWDEAENAVEYKVFKKVGDNVDHGSWVKTNSYKFSSVPAQDYEIYVAARNSDASHTSWSDHVAIKVAKPLGTATNVKVDKDGKVTWTKAQNAVKYKVVKIVNGKSYGGKEVTKTSSSITVPTSDYQVYVAAFGENGAKTISEKISVKVDNPLGVVNDVTVDSNGKVTWAAAKNAVEYKVAKVVDGKTYYTDKVTETTATITPATKDYQVFVVAFDKDGKKSWGKKNLVEVGNLGTVLDPKVDANGNVSWTAARNAVKYKVGKVVNGRTYYTGELTKNSATISVPKSDYKVFVVAFDKDGNKTWGTKVDVKV